jgi:hypothetical protein
MVYVVKGNNWGEGRRSVRGKFGRLWVLVYKREHFLLPETVFIPQRVLDLMKLAQSCKSVGLILDI